MIPLPGDPRKSTERVKHTVLVLNERFPSVGSMGIYNRRKKASGGWSDHAWGNAIDITSPPAMLKPDLYATEYEANRPEYELHMAYMDAIYDWLNHRRHVLGIRNLIWRRYMHRNHIHVDFYPRPTGTPPILGPLPIEEDILKKGDEGPRVVKAQERLLELGYELPQWGADGDYGDETVLAVRQFQKANNLDPDGILQAVDLAILFEESGGSDAKARNLAKSAHSRLDKLHEV